MEVRWNRIAALCVLASVLAWEALAVLNIIPIQKFPPPSAIITSAMRGYSIVELIEDAAASVSRMFVSYIICLVIALTVGIGLTRKKVLEDMFLPVTDIIQALPCTALLPLALIWFGVGDVAAIFILVTAMLWLIFYGVIGSVKNVRRDLIEMARIQGAGGLRILLTIVLPSMIPSLVTPLVSGIN